MPDLIYKLEKSRDDIERLLEEHRNLVYYCLSQCALLDNADCESAAWEALWDAICTFSVYEQTLFSTYACTCIMRAINGASRKQDAYNKRHIELPKDAPEPVTSMAFIDESIDSLKVLDIIQDVFEEHLASTRGVSKDVLLFWRSKNFDESKTEIAKACGTSVSYVSRVMTAFKARLSGRLKGL